MGSFPETHWQHAAITQWTKLDKETTETYTATVTATDSFGLGTGFRKADPGPDEHAERQVREWVDGEPEELTHHRYPVCVALPRPRATSSSAPAPSTRSQRLTKPGARASGPVRRSSTPPGLQRA